MLHILSAMYRLIEFANKDLTKISRDKYQANVVVCADINEIKAPTPIF